MNKNSIFNIKIQFAHPKKTAKEKAECYIKAKYGKTLPEFAYAVMDANKCSEIELPYNDGDLKFLHTVPDTS